MLLYGRDTQATMPIGQPRGRQWSIQPRALLTARNSQQVRGQVRGALHRRAMDWRACNPLSRRPRPTAYRFWPPSHPIIRRQGRATACGAGAWNIAVSDFGGSAMNASSSMPRTSLANRFSQFLMMVSAAQTSTPLRQSPLARTVGKGRCGGRTPNGWAAFALRSPPRTRTLQATPQTLPCARNLLDRTVGFDCPTPTPCPTECRPPL